MREAAEFDVKDFDDPQSTSGVYARFYFVPVQDVVKSEEEGRPIFKDVEYIEIIAAGNSTNIIRRPARDRERQLYRREYEMFKAGDIEQLIGTPLSQVTFLSRAQVEELMYRKIRTVEHLANVSDTDCNVPGMLDLRRKAQAFLEKAKGNDALHAEVDTLKQQVAELMEANRALLAKQGAQVNKKAEEPAKA